MNLTKLGVAVAILIFTLSSCSRQLPQPKFSKAKAAPSVEQPCAPEFDPPETYVNSLGNMCVNNCHYVYEGRFTTEPNLSWVSEVNCIENPTNWTFEIDENQHGKFFKIRATHPVIEGGQNLGLCSNFLILEPVSGECSEVFEILFVNAGSSMWTTARLDIYMSSNFWECYDPDGWAFNFRITARQNLPIYSS